MLAGAIEENIPRKDDKAMTCKVVMATMHSPVSTIRAKRTRTHQPEKQRMHQLACKNEDKDAPASVDEEVEQSNMLVGAGKD